MWEVAIAVAAKVDGRTTATLQRQFGRFNFERKIFVTEVLTINAVKFETHYPSINQFSTNKLKHGCPQEFFLKRLRLTPPFPISPFLFLCFPFSPPFSALYSPLCQVAT